jgi:hypothetical protein
MSISPPCLPRSAFLAPVATTPLLDLGRPASLLAASNDLSEMRPTCGVKPPGRTANTQPGGSPPCRCPQS